MRVFVNNTNMSGNALVHQQIEGRHNIHTIEIALLKQHIGSMQVGIKIVWKKPSYTNTDTEKNWNSRHKYMLEKRPLSYYTKPTDQSIKGKAAHCDKSPKWIAVMFSLEITSAFGWVFGNQTHTKETRKCMAHCAFNWECFVQCQRERTIYTNICQSQIHSHSYPEFYIYFRTYNESDATLPVFLVIITYTWAVWSRLFTSLPLFMMLIVYVLFKAN